MEASLKGFSFKTMRIPTFLKGLSISFAAAAATIPQEAKTPIITPEQQFKMLVAALPSVVKDFTSAKPDLAYEVATTFSDMKKTCPSMSHINIRSAWNLADWLNKNVTEEEWKKTPYNFRRDALRGVSIQNASQTKIEVLGKLQNAMEFDPNFIIWMNKGTEKFEYALANDPFLNKEKKDWKDVTRDDPRLKAYLTRINDIFMQSFFNNKKIAMPSVRISYEDQKKWAPEKRWAAAYDWEKHAIVYNFNSIRKDPKTADSFTAHETFHAIENMIKKLYLTKTRLPSYMSDAAEKFFYQSNRRLAYTGSEMNADVYHNTFIERASYNIEYSVGGDKIPDYKNPDWVKAHPLSNNEFDHPNLGTMPKACFK